jgi:hypothetical protein
VHLPTTDDMGTHLESSQQTMHLQSLRQDYSPITDNNYQTCHEVAADKEQPSLLDEVDALNQQKDA